MDKKDNSNKPWHKRWRVWAGIFGALFVLSLIFPNGDDKVVADDPVEEVVKAEVVKAPKKSPEELAKITADTEAKNKADEERWLAEQAEKDAANEINVQKKADAKLLELEEKTKVAEVNTEAMNEIIAISEGLVTEIQPNTSEWEVVNVTVDDVWYQAPEHSKERLVESVASRIRADSSYDITDIHFNDTYGKRVASQAWFSEDYIIER